MKQKKILSWLLLLAMLLLCACNGGTGSGEKGTERAEETGEPSVRNITLALNGKASYKIVIPEMCDEKITKAANALKEKLTMISGVFFSVGVTI